MKIPNNIVQQSHEQGLLTVDDILEDQFVENKNEVRNLEINVPNYSSFKLNNTGKEFLVGDFRTTMNNKDMCSFHPKNQHPLNSKDVVFQHVSQNQAYLNDSSFNVMANSELPDMNKQINYFEKLSPVMEFDDLKIYSLPHNTETTTNNIVFEDMNDTNEKHDKKPFGNFETMQKNINLKSWNENPSFHENIYTNFKPEKTLNTIQFKEVKVKRMPSEKIFHQKTLNIKPSNQHFNLTITPSTQTFTKKLAQYKVANNNQNKITEFFKRKETADTTSQSTIGKIGNCGRNGFEICSDIKKKEINEYSIRNRSGDIAHDKNNDLLKNSGNSSDEKSSHLGSKKMVQTSLVKLEETKRSINEQQKPKKISRFIVPIKTSHSTSQEIKVKNYTITILDEISAKEILQKFESDKLIKMLITVTFKEGYTLLNKPLESLRNSGCLPSGVMFQAFWFQGNTNYYYLNLVNVTSALLPVIQKFLTTPVKVVCFEVQAVYMLLIDVFHIQDTTGWMAFDPLVGCWLLDPDNPVTNFAEVLNKLELDNELLVVSYKADIKTQACDLLPVLDITMDIMEKRLSATSLWTVFTDLEMKLTPLLAIMECSSIFVDIKKLHETSRVIDKRLRKLQKEAYELVGHPFQLNSHQQLRNVLFDELKLDAKFNIVVKQTEQGAKSTSEVVLCQLKRFHPLPKIVLEQRHLQKVKSTYVDGLQQFVRKDGTIGSTWEQTGAATGRITSKNPNLQAIPKVPVVLQDLEKIYLRAIFKSREGFSFLAADFQQIEFRVFAHFTQDENIIQMFREGRDIFTQLAGQWLGGDGGEEREKIKRIVYSVMYGAGPQKLAEYLHVDIHEAARIITNFVAFTEVSSLSLLLKHLAICGCKDKVHVSLVVSDAFTEVSSLSLLLKHLAICGCKDKVHVSLVVSDAFTEVSSLSLLLKHLAICGCKDKVHVSLVVSDGLWEQTCPLSLHRTFFSLSLLLKHLAICGCKDKVHVSLVVSDDLWEQTCALTLHSSLQS
ncbi:hypothetical protein J6590_057535 [Homalodisca vitripennis]|nr:hypothetical protein J6590_057535 [Homalodisca vitripennis]